MKRKDTQDPKTVRNKRQTPTKEIFNENMPKERKKQKTTKQKNQRKIEFHQKDRNC